MLKAALKRCTDTKPPGVERMRGDVTWFTNASATKMIESTLLHRVHFVESSTPELIRNLVIPEVPMAGIPRTWLSPRLRNHRISGRYYNAAVNGDDFFSGKSAAMRRRSRQMLAKRDVAPPSKKSAPTVK